MHACECFWFLLADIEQLLMHVSVSVFGFC